MLCRDAQFYLRLRRHAGDELGADVAGDLDAHLTGCPACAADAQSAASFDRAVSAAMRAVPVPAGLRDKLHTLAAAHRGGVIRRKTYRVVALAASLFLAVGMAFGVFSATRPKLDANALVMAHDEQIQDPDGALKRWLAGQKFPDRLPLALDATLIVSMGTERVQGRDVPVVVFATPNDPRIPRGFAKVYLIRTDGTFDLRGLREAQASFTQALVIDDRQFRGVRYVVIHTGQDLTPFLLRGPSA